MLAASSTWSSPVKGRGWILHRRSFRSRMPIARSETSSDMSVLVGRPYDELRGEHSSGERRGPGGSVPACILAGAD